MSALQRVLRMSLSVIDLSLILMIGEALFFFGNVISANTFLSLTVPLVLVLYILKLSESACPDAAFSTPIYSVVKPLNLDPLSYSNGTEKPSSNGINRASLESLNFSPCTLTSLVSSEYVILEFIELKELMMDFFSQLSLLHSICSDGLSMDSICYMRDINTLIICLA